MNWPIKRPRVIVGARSPLFDRLTDLEPLRPGEAFIERALGVEEMKASIARELGRLLDTRCGLELGVAAVQPERTVLDYGIPDLGLRSPAEGDARTLLARAIRHAVIAFEPRLATPSVVVRQDPQSHARLIVEISASLIVGDLVEPIAFARAISGGAQDDDER